MNYLDICEMVFEEIDGRVASIPTTDLGRDAGGALFLSDPFQRKVVKAVATAYSRICRASQLWSFLHSSGVLFEVVAGEDEYDLPGVSRINKHGLWLEKEGSSAKYPVCRMSYQEYTQLLKRTVIQPSVPTNLIQKEASTTWLLYPTPAFDGQIFGDWWIVPPELKSPSDEPLWETQFHDLIVWVAIKDLSFDFFQDSKETGAALAQRAEHNTKAMFLEFQARYLPALATL